MKAPKTLARPENWQDFETLCKKLWGEIWKCPEIKKNGRSGQDQSGVDVCGIPVNETEYYGIQCKGKDEYTHKQLTQKEIDVEIEKASNFKPKLKKLYFATTAIKDATIEEYVRIKNLELIEKGSFEVHLFCWEDIVDLIYENQETYNYYVNSINFKSTHGVDITFHDNSHEITVYPKFKIKRTYFKQKIVLESDYVTDYFQNAFRPPPVKGFPVYTRKDEVNHSFFSFFIKIYNSGTTAIENYKLQFEFEGNIQSLSDTNEILNAIRALIVQTNTRFTNTTLYPENLNGVINPTKTILVGDDSIVSTAIFVKPFPEESTIAIHWKLLSKSYKTEGKLLVHVKPQIETEEKTVFIEDPNKIRMEDGEIEDSIVEMDK